MLDRGQIERILRLNGLSAENADEEIISLLRSARWRDDDVDEAIIILRQDPNTPQAGGYRVNDALRTDKKLAPETLNSLLGIDVQVNNIADQHRTSLRHTYNIQVFSLVLLSILFALAFLIVVVQYTGFDVLR